MDAIDRASYAFGRYQLSADGTLLVRDGARVPLAPLMLRTLLVLVQRAGQVVTKDELIRTVWPDSFVEESGLSRNISLLRHALGDEAKSIIVTAPRIGYSFAAPVSAGQVAAGTRTHGSNGDGVIEPTSEVPAEERPAAATPTRLLILPFRILRPDPDTDFLAFSVPDAVVGALSGLESLVVRSSAVAVRLASESPDLQRIAVEAHVDAIVTGTLMRSASHILVSAQLVAVPCCTVRWAESFRVDLRDVFELQDRLVERIVSSLALSLNPSERTRLRNDVPSSPAAYEYFLRGNESIGPQGIENSSNLRVARGLYLRAVEADPRFAPAWVRLARCHYLIGKSGEQGDENMARAESCFERAFDLSPDLPIAHNLYALMEIDQGRASSALSRLIARGLAGSAQPELYAALVQACRFCGLLEASVTAHRRARELDPSCRTGGYLAYWQLGDDDGSIREGVNLCWLVEAVIVGMRGDTRRAIEMLQEERGLTGFASSLTASTRSVFENRPAAAFESAAPIFDAFPDPEAAFYAARNIAAFGDRRALDLFRRSLDRGFVLYRVLLKDDAWLDPLRSTAEFQALVERSRERYRECLEAYVAAGGERLLGPVPGPDVLEADVAVRPGRSQSQRRTLARVSADGRKRPARGGSRRLMNPRL